MRLKTALRKSGLNQTQLAKKLGMSQCSISAWRLKGIPKKRQEAVSALFKAKPRTIDSQKTLGTAITLAASPRIFISGRDTVALISLVLDSNVTDVAKLQAVKTLADNLFKTA